MEISLVPIYIYIYIEREREIEISCKLGERSRGPPGGSIFNSDYTEVKEKVQLLSWIAILIPDSYLIMPNVKARRHLWHYSTWDWRPVSRAMGELCNHYAKWPVVVEALVRRLGNSYFQANAIIRPSRLWALFMQSDSCCKVSIFSFVLTVHVLELLTL